MPRTLSDIAAANRAGEPVGIPAYCSANAETLRAVLSTYAHDDEPVLIEASANQVNQFGGYAGMTPAGFRNFIDILAAGEGVDPARVILGASNLGPYPWRAEPAASAMDKAKAMVAAFVEAGFTKLHLDARFAETDDEPLADELKAEHVALLCAVAETASSGRPLSYVLGIDTPSPGGETGPLEAVTVTTPAAAHRALELYEAAFTNAGQRDALDRVIAVVVQPGACFNNAEVLAFDPARSEGLGETVFDIPGAVFEAQAIDYQTQVALEALVAGHFAILKVGPELGAAFRRAVVAMAHLESFLSVRRSNILTIIEDEMVRDPAGWRDHFPEDDRSAAMRLFGLSDRIRYYWSRPRVAAALQMLFANIDHAHPEAGLLGQYAPAQEPGARAPLPLSARIIRGEVSAVVQKYRRATRSG